MSWLYNHRYQLDGLYPLAVIAFFAVVSRVPPEDQDDVEQEIVILLREVIKKHGNKPKSYLEAVARNRVYEYFNKKYRERERLRYILENEKGEIIRRLGGTLHRVDARMDAIATLATMPERLIQIGHKLEDGEKLSEADQNYWVRQKAKLNCRRYSNRPSDWEKRRILKLHSEGMSVSKIARTMGRNYNTVMRALHLQPLSRRDYLVKTELATKEMSERIRNAYFVEGKTIKQIERELRYSPPTITKAIHSGAAIV